MAVVGGVLFCVLLIGMGCLVWYKRGRRIERTARKMADAAVSGAESIETGARETVNAVEKTIRKI